MTVAIETPFVARRVLAMYGIFEPSSRHLEQLRKLGVEVVVAKDEATALATAPECEVVFGHRFLRQILPRAAKLRWVQTTAGGVDRLPCAELHNQNVILTRTTYTVPAIARHAHTLAWSLQRQIPEASTRHRAGRWDTAFHWLPAPKRAGIFGTGRIGREIARLLQRDGIITVGIRKTTDGTTLPEFSELHASSHMRDLLPTFDWCFLALPHTGETNRLFDEATLRLLPPHALLINVGRGQTVDSAALSRVLTSGHLGGAALDVVDTEPMPIPELRSTPRLLLTPHIAAHYAERQADAERFSEEQLARFQRGQPLENIVDFIGEGLVS